MSHSNEPPEPDLLLLRSRKDRLVAGVCGGIAHRLGIDPTLVRVVAAVLALFGGAGLLLYALGWLLMPDETSRSSVVSDAMNPSHGDRTAAILLAAGLSLLTLLVFGGLLSNSWVGILLLALTLLAAAGLVRRDDRRRTGGSPPAGPDLAAARSGPSAGPATGGSGSSLTPPEPSEVSDPTISLGPLPAPASSGSFGSPPTPAPPGSLGAPTTLASPVEPVPSTTARRRSRLGRTTFFVALLAVGLLGLVDLTGEIPGASTIGQGAVPLAAYPALVLAVAGLGLLVGTFWGRARGLILLGVVALVALVPTTAVSVASGDMSGGVARGTVVRPKTLEALDDVQTQHSAGQVTYDLSGLDLDGRDVELELGLGAGELTVLLPQRAGADVLANVGIGKAYVLGRLEDGFGVTASDTRPGHPGGGTVDLTVEVGVGQAKVS